MICRDSAVEGETAARSPGRGFAVRTLQTCAEGSPDGVEFDDDNVVFDFRVTGRY